MLVLLMAVLTAASGGGVAYLFELELDYDFFLNETLASLSPAASVMYVPGISWPFGGQALVFVEPLGWTDALDLFTGKVGRMPVYDMACLLVALPPPPPWPPDYTGPYLETPVGRYPLEFRRDGMGPIWTHGRHEAEALLRGNNLTVAYGGKAALVIPGRPPSSNPKCRLERQRSNGTGPASPTPHGGPGEAGGAPRAQADWWWAPAAVAAALLFALLLLARRREAQAPAISGAAGPRPWT